MVEAKQIKISTGSFLILLQSFFFGFGDPISKVAYEEMSVYSILAVRFSLAFVLMLLMGRRALVEDIRRSEVRVWIVPSLCLGSAYIAGNLALDFAPATSVAFLRSLSTLFTPVLAFAVFRTRFRRIHLPFLIAIVVGLYLLCGAGGMNSFGAGEMIALGCALLSAAALVFSGEAIKKMKAMTISTIQLGVAATLSVLCAFIFDGGVSMAGASMQSWGVVLYLAVFCSIAGYLLQNKAFETISPRAVALLQCSCPVCTAVFSFFILGEQLSAAGLVGVVIILVCVTAETIIG
ncbi:MAG: DMT family transporter [Oscillospiraceae bacterium]|nr:DMT family transporter [Oscillospiraceae bacterium]